MNKKKGEISENFHNEIIEELEQKKKLKNKSNNNIMIFFTTTEEKFNLAFDYLIRYNPIILIEAPIFNLEYHKDGTTKTYEEIWIERTEENKDLIDEILRTRYPESTNITQNQNHTKQKYMS